MLSTDCWKIFKNIVEPASLPKVVHQRLHGNPSAGEDNGAAHDLF